MFRLLLTRRWVILTLVFFVLIPVMYLLGVWQVHRYQQTNRGNQLISQNLAAGPVPMESLSKPGAVVPSTEMYRTVTATGHFESAQEFVVRHRTDASGDDIGFYVVTPLVTADGDVVLVNRGWVDPGNASGAQYPVVPPAPGGTVTVTGRLRPDETSAATGIRDVPGLPPRQYMLIDSRQQAKRLPEPVVAGYLELIRTSPTPPAADSAELVPGPNNTQSDSEAVVGKGVHLPYAIQWWLFALMIPAGWFALLRRDAREQRHRETVAAKAAAFREAAAAKAAGDTVPVAAPAGAGGE